ncbi:hypothetical protein LSCM1_01978 [Leishmania martiniquensis]|uniref:Uncharacterized protein n=1 Tax=Leishmania martiniquensis TaxID=1580590 RepID=A0A836GRY4_9TRYP|nr:hypothetical protein LSCM1_01978 [Leishmania martiniquensis]
MIFDPCGDLLKDYSAFCESLRVIEREDVYSAICTRVVDVPPLPAGALETPGGAGGDSRDGGDRRFVSANAAAKGSRPANRATSKEKERAGAGGKHKNRRKSSLEAAPKAADEELPPQLPETAVITYVSLHYPVFCLNQRDMMPLSRAIPHCPSLLSVELVGCGLSAQSYMQLVEAVYRSPRILSVAVDFNQHIRGTSFTDTSVADVRQAGALASAPGQAGFVVDLTVRNAVSLPLGDTLEMSAAGLCSPQSSSENVQERPFGSNAVTAAPAGGASAADTATSGGGSSARVSKSDLKSATVRNAPTSQSAETDAPAAGAAELQRAEEAGNKGRNEGDSALYFYPMQYCGLDKLPTPLEVQLQEEMEKKGKVDGKRLQQVQAQRDALRTFNQQNRMAVPRTWDGILFTGIRLLSLRGNGIDDAAVTRIVNVLLQNPRSQLESLNLWGNNITDVGATALGQLLRHNRDILVLDVGSNELSDVGLLELIDTFRMQQMSSMEDLLAVRRAYLTRRCATDEDRKAAGQSLSASDIPSYEDIYAYWWYTQQQQLHRQRATSSSATERSGAADGISQAFHKLSLSSAYYLPPPPPHRDASLSPSSSSSGKRASPAKNKATKSESAPGGCSGGSTASAAATMSSSAARAAMRPTAAFDRDCVRVCHAAESDLTFRVPGNITLEVLNVEENRYVTIAGAREAARRLALHEPATTAEMLSMIEVRDAHSTQSLSPSAPLSAASATTEVAGKRPSYGIHRSAASTSQVAPTLSTVIRPPELHCAGLRLRVCAVRCHRESDRGTWPEMDEVQQRLNASLEQWACSRGSAAMRG